jgi:hypothetical protein
MFGYISVFNLCQQFEISYSMYANKLITAYLLEFPDTSSEYVQWVRIDSSIFGTDKNGLLGNIYIPPENTKYS